MRVCVSIDLKHSFRLPRREYVINPMPRSGGFRSVGGLDDVEGLEGLISFLSYLRRASSPASFDAVPRACRSVAGPGSSPLARAAHRPPSRASDTPPGTWLARSPIHPAIRTVPHRLREGAGSDGRLPTRPGAAEPASRSAPPDRTRPYGG